ncbi:MAG TPA: hypothetical protein VEJ21_05650 [Acidimicrobiales bacterium]|nr:hypothetical protein [Acidimicrobiales bacterium]
MSAGRKDAPAGRSVDGVERIRRRRRLQPPRRGVHRCMVLATGPEDTTAVDLRTHAFVRLRMDGAGTPAPVESRAASAAGSAAGSTALSEPETSGMSSGDETGLPPDTPRVPDPETAWDDGGLLPFDVVDAIWAEDPQRDDLAQPEAVTLSGAPTLVGRLRGRRARRLLKGLVAPPAQHLLGFPGSAAPYWEFHGMRPSVALVVPSRGPLLFRRQPDNSVWARFGWPRIDQWLPVEDRRATAALWASGRDRLSGRALVSALGFRPDFLLVTVTRPRQGHCYKTVKALLPRP